jgi:anti-sigma factor RsiW
MNCDQVEQLRDYAMGELGPDGRAAMERHMAGCADCAAELHALQLTTAALRSLPDREIPQRIAFVSDKVFEPSGAARWFAGFWNSAARLGFASACVLSAALLVVAYHRPAAGENPVAMQAGITKADVDKEINEAVTKAVAQVKAEDGKATAEILAASEQKHEQEHKALVVTMGENLDILQRRMTAGMMLASNDQERFGGGR